MKKIVMLSVLFLIVVSCSKSSNEETIVYPNALAIQGKWQLVEDLDYNPQSWCANPFAFLFNK